MDIIYKKYEQNNGINVSILNINTLSMTHADFCRVNATRAIIRVQILNNQNYVLQNCI